MGWEAVSGPNPGTADGSTGGPPSPITDMKARPRTGSVDLALGVGVGMCIGGAAVFVVLATMRKRRLQRWRSGAGGLNAEGFMGLNESSRGEASRGQRGGRWPRRRRGGFPVRGKEAVAVRQVAIELGRRGFDGGDSSDDEAFAKLKLHDEEEASIREDEENEHKKRHTSSVSTPDKEAFSGEGARGEMWRRGGGRRDTGSSGKESTSSSWRRTKRQPPRKSSSHEALLGGDGGGDEEDDG